MRVQTGLLRLRARAFGQALTPHAGSFPSPRPRQKPCSSEVKRAAARASLRIVTSVAAITANITRGPSAPAAACASAPYFLGDSANVKLVQTCVPTVTAICNQPKLVILTGQRRSASNCNCEAAISVVPVLFGPRGGLAGR